MRSILATIAVLVLVAGGAACGGEPQATPEKKARIETVAPAKADYPRTISTAAGAVTIAQKPMRIHTLSVGFDEVTFALVDISRVVAVGTSTANPDFSNVADLAAMVPNKIKRDLEAIVALKPDVVIAPAAKRQADLVEALKQAGITVVVTDLTKGVDALVQNVRFLASVYGEEAKAEELIGRLQTRLEFVKKQLQGTGEAKLPRVLMLAGDLYASGKGSAGDDLIARAGGINAAAEAGVQGDAQIGIESIAAMDPDIILLPNSNSERPGLQRELLGNPALAGLRALKEQRVYIVRSQWVGTLSHWNVHGVEMLAKLLHPEKFAGQTSNGFAYEPVKAAA